MSENSSQDIAALAKGGRTNFFGFLLRLAGTAPFLFIAGRAYGVEALGRYASALVIVELTSQLCALGQRRGLAQRLAEDERPHAHVIADGMILSLVLGIAAALLFFVFPAPMFPSGEYSRWDRLLPLAILPNALTDIALAGLAYRYDVAATVRARSIVEPWTMAIMAVALFSFIPEGGLALSYIIAKTAAAAVALWPLLKAFGLPHHWRPHPLRTWRLALASSPLAGADMVEWGSRKLDIAILGMVASPRAVGVYYAAQQIASLPQKLKTSFEPILGPVITRNLKEKNYAAIALQVCQVGFWITAAQAGIALSLGVPGEAVMGLVGKTFVGGTGALNLLLLAEVVAATAVVSEAALIYMARLKNLAVSLCTIALQAALTITFVLLIPKMPDMNLPFGIKVPRDHVANWQSAGAAAALMLSLAFASITKGFILSRVLGQRINNWRWSLIVAVVPALAAGYVVTRLLPHWLQLIVGVPFILLTYGTIIWRWGFGPDDRVLFRRNVAGKAQESA
ncbi:lipopolysaccharide biosynthesis protein [Parablastomonas sp. CN1-191]|uniref:lipopolysaccharide biosynthesis protein n=1 Tax=Parablastomonas sp. CN1-191 TaxID=3400908 RepID=UPI003BF82ED4